MSEHPTAKGETERTATLPDSAGEARVIGHYRLLQKIGEGGMGEVWEAEQTEPVQRRVALKLIKRGMDSAQVIARFETERQALALMDHPAIANVFDAGTTQHGRPFFVMELVHGVPITQYCDRHRMTVRQRLELFIRVCEGIQHAHQKAIIHRDVKPSNVLVGEQDGRPTPKIIDFGVAKATAQRLTEQTLFTELGQLIGTPEYMSPEQAELTGEDIDIRTDVYSLGMVLYQLLVGALPFDPKELRSAGLVELQRKIREEEPSKPSTRVTRRGEASTRTAENRRTTVQTLVRNLRGDLDWIVMKALDKDRGRRYETAHAFAADIKRFLCDQAVSARPPSAAYRARKFVRRHRVGVAALSFVLLSLLVTIIITTSSLVRATKAEEIARAEADRATAVTSFLEAMLSSADPAQDGRDVRVVEVIDRASQEVRSQFENQPETEASVRETLAKTFLALGQFEPAAEQFEIVHRIRTEHLGPGHASTLKAALNVAAVTWYLGEPERAEELIRRILQTATESLGPDHELALEARTNLAVFLDSQGKSLDAEPLHRSVLELARARYGSDHETTWTAANNLAICLKKLGELTEAEALYRETLAARTRIAGAEHPQTLNVKHNLAMLLTAQGNSSEAAKLHRETLEAKLRVFGPEHPQVLSSMNGLGMALTAEEDFDEAVAIFEELVALADNQYQSTHRKSVLYRMHYGDCLLKMGRTSEAEEVLTQMYVGLRDALGPSHSSTMEVAELLVGLYEAEGQPEKAAKYRAEPESN